MATELTVNGIVYQYPENDDIDWGTAATDWATAVSQSTLQKTGGTFTLTNEVNFGATYGIKTPYVKTIAANPSTVGIVRLANSDSIAWRNAANTADLALSLTGDSIRFNSAELIDANSTQTLTNKTYYGTSLVLGGGTALTTTNQTGTGNLVLQTSPTLTTPNIGVATGTSLALGGGTALTTTNRTGTGNLVLATSPTLTTPVLGVASATTINKVTITAPATSATLTLAEGSTLATVGSYSTTFTTTGITSVALPTSGTLATLSGTETLSNKTLVQTNATENKAALLQVKDFIPNSLISGMVPPTSASLTAITTAGVAYVNGVRVVTPATSNTYTASRDTYVDISSAGVFTYPAVTNGAGAPAVTADSMRIAKVVTNGSAVTTVTMLKVPSTAFGLGAGASITTGVDNVCIGVSAGAAITTGYENLMIGTGAGQATTTGFDNVNIGTYAGYLNQDGYENINIGALAGRNIVAGYDNVNIGPNAGRSTTSGNGNTVIGNRAGYTLTPANAITTGTNNVYVGQNAGGASTSQFDNSIAIGNEATVNASNTWVVGKLGTKQAIKEGTNGVMGLATLVAGTVTVNTTAVTANSRIFLTPNVAGGTPGWVRVSARTAGTSFTITSSSGTDTSGIAWEIKEPA